MERWTNDYPYNEDIANATEEELVNMADEAEMWNIFSIGCLRELCWRHDVNFDTIDDPDLWLKMFKASIE